ncbi:MAG: zinc transporter permease [Arthrobacter sp.]|jgi:zinc transport system permease protein|nr:zinc transporter permease [Arthrobacter sp.]MCU1520426.1 zinc transporter permease [Arthrobacter sp.]
MSITPEHASPVDPDDSRAEHKSADHEHSHEHGPGCGHETVEHDGHVDYLHDGHRHAAHDDHYDEH